MNIVAIEYTGYARISSGSSGQVTGVLRNMKSMRLPLMAIFFMTNFYRARGGAMAPSASPRSATAYWLLQWSLIGHPVGIKNLTEI